MAAPDPERSSDDDLPNGLWERIIDAIDGSPDRPSRHRARDALCANYPRWADAIRRAFERFDPSRPGQDAEPATSEAHPAFIGPYRILERLGAGGMGVVYLAEQREPIQRRVAVKVIKRGMDSDAILGRFESERQALALMEHGNIARIYDAGLTDGGQPYFAMEYVKGVPITRYCDQYRLSVEQRLGLFVQVCGAVQHAHNKGIVHRDLTPNNILVTLQDGAPTPKIIDFGLARATDHRRGQHTVFTEHDAIIGTPEYMSPEQAGLDRLDIDTRTDVYTLGVVLYELLVGELPLTGADIRRAGILEMQRRIREDLVPRPSSRITTGTREAVDTASRRRTHVSTLRRKLRDELDWCVLKALEKDRTLRYETVSEFAADLRRYLAGGAVHAGPPSASRRVRRFLRQHWPRLLVVSTAFAVLIGAWYLEREKRVRASQLQVLAEAEARRLRSHELIGSARSSMLEEVPATLAALESWVQDAARLANALERSSRELASMRGRHGDAIEGVDVAAVLDHLATDLGALRASDLQSDVRARIDRIRSIERQTITEAVDSWTRAAERVRSNPRYAGLELRPTFGLLPLGPDPDTSLEEFAHPASGVPPTRDPSGPLRVTEDVSLVFVLLPAAETRLGAVRHSDRPTDVDDSALEHEGPVADLHIDALFVSKFEMSQHQWITLTRSGNPSRYFPAKRGTQGITFLDPVEFVSWKSAHAVLACHGLALPTEAQWEYGCRGGTRTPWWTGATRESLQDAEGGLVNIADRTAIRAGFPFAAASAWPEYADPYVVHGPSGLLPANPFGLHDVHGNVFEWCRDPWVEDVSSFRQGDGLRQGNTEPGSRPVRGGSFHKDYLDCRSSARKKLPEDSAYDDVGLRPVLLIAPEPSRPEERSR